MEGKLMFLNITLLSRAVEVDKANDYWREFHNEYRGYYYND